MNREQKWSRDALVDEYDSHLHQTCGASLATRRHYTRYVREFLGFRFGSQAVEPSTLTPGDLIQFVAGLARSCPSRSPKPKAVATALRSFLRFLQLLGLARPGLLEAVPTVPRWKLRDLPSSLTRAQVKQLLAAFDRSTPSGLRGRTAVICMVGLGLRVGEVARLSIDDFDWRAGRVRLPETKGARGSLLPLPQDVGRAIVEYLRKGRPVSERRNVFIRHRVPVGTPIGPRLLQAQIRRAFRRAGIEAPSHGTHILRRTAATRMVQEGATLKEVADILRHRSLNTTSVYTRIDLPMLSTVAMPWPEMA